MGSTPIAGAPFFVGGLAYTVSLVWWVRHGDGVADGQAMQELEAKAGRRVEEFKPEGELA